MALKKESKFINQHECHFKANGSNVFNFNAYFIKRFTKIEQISR